MNTLKLALIGNAVMSLLTGLILSIFPKQVAAIFATTQYLPFLLIGLALLYFCATIVLEVYKQRPLPILWIIIQDILWVAASAYIILARPLPISEIGYGLIAVIAVLVLLFSVFQTLGLAKLDNKEGANSKQLHFSRKVPTSKAIAWSLISDLGGYAAVASNIDQVKIISGSGEGMQRVCSHGEESWTETCTLWEEEKAYSFTVDTAAPDYPYPFRSLKGTWEIRSANDQETEIVMTFAFEFNRWIQNVLIYPFMKNQFKKICEEILDRWEAKSIALKKTDNNEIRV